MGRLLDVVVEHEADLYEPSNDNDFQKPISWWVNHTLFDVAVTSFSLAASHAIYPRLGFYIGFAWHHRAFHTAQRPRNTQFPLLHVPTGLTPTSPWPSKRVWLCLSSERRLSHHVGKRTSIPDGSGRFVVSNLP
ncbi:hypothetical protein LIA77_04860 [Sarocladium implicatum]|nr:hypothetical protein LIA77_04860 [Sarocladium implicatum]